MLRPNDTYTFLTQLESEGFTDEQFRIVHFKPTETIKSHRDYVSSINKFKTGGRNLIVCKRLQFLFDSF